MSIAWALDLRRIREVLLELLVEPAEGGVAVVEGEDKEEDQRRRSSVASGGAPLQAPELVEGGPMWPGCSQTKVPGKRGGGCPPARKPVGRHPLWKATAPRDR